MTVSQESPIDRHFRKSTLRSGRREATFVRKSRKDELKLGGSANLEEVAKVLKGDMDSRIALAAVEEIQNTPIFTWSTEEKF